MARVSETIGQQGWPGGITAATDPALLGPLASPRGLNTALAQASQGVPFVQKRSGLAVVNETPITGSGAIIGQYGYRRIANSTDYHLLASNTGRLDSRASNDTLSNLSTSLTSGEHYPDFATANDLCFLVNSQDRLKFDGTSVTNFGITRPTVGTMAGAAGIAGLHNGTYELRVTFANSDTGHESGASDTASATVTVTNDAIDWTDIPVSADAQVDTRYLYARNTATQTSFYRVGTVADNTATTATTSIADADATVAAPGTTDRGRPPSSARFLAWHQGRLFVATSTDLYWSRIGEPEAFDLLATDGVNRADGQRITGLYSFGDILLILKEDRLYGLFNGNDPAVWQITLIDNDYGCVAHRTLVAADGALYWWSRHGACRWDGATVRPIGELLYGDVTDLINQSQITRASACKDEAQNRIMFAVPGTLQSRATLLIPFHTTLQQFEATYWDPMDAASLGNAVDSAGSWIAWLGGYSGQLFQMWSGNNDGAATGSVSGTWVATGESVTTFSDLLTEDDDGATVPATLDTTGAGLIERKVTFIDSDGLIVGSTRRYITANGADSFTLNAAVDGFTTNATYTWYVGGPDFQFDTPWRTYDLPWLKKRYEFFFVLTKGLNYGASAAIDLAFDYDEANANGRERTLTSSSVSGLWDVAIWDQDVWDVAANVQQRFRVARVGFAWRARIRNAAPNQPLALLSLAMRAATQTEKR